MQVADSSLAGLDVLVGSAIFNHGPTWSGGWRVCLRGRFCHGHGEKPRNHRHEPLHFAVAGKLHRMRAGDRRSR